MSSQWGKISLWDAAADGNIEYCKKKLDENLMKIDQGDAKGCTPLHEAARWGQTETVKYLVSRGANPTLKAKDGGTALHYAAQNGKDDTIRYLAKELKLDINAQDNFGDTPLMNASARGHVSTTKLFLTEFNADRNVRNNNGRTAEQLANGPAITALFKDPAYTSPTKY